MLQLRCAHTFPVVRYKVKNLVLLSFGYDHDNFPFFNQVAWNHCIKCEH